MNWCPPAPCPAPAVITITPQSLRLDFPEFGDPQRFTNSQINFWIGIAGKLLNSFRWGDLLDHGAALFVAHHLALSAKAQLTAQAGGVPGATQGVLTSKSVDKVSAGYDPSSVTLEGGGIYNTTSYGVEFLYLARQIGTGGIQVLEGGLPFGLGTWAGPFSGNGFGWI
jgi:hypothetical protein